MSVQFPISQNPPLRPRTQLRFREDTPEPQKTGESPRPKRKPSALRRWLKKHDWPLTKLLQLTSTLGAFYLASEALIYPLTRGPAMSENNRWGENVVSVGSSSQRHASFDSNFTNALIRKLRQDDIQNLSQACRSLTDKGYKSIFGLQQYAKMNATHLQGWEKAKDNPNRFVLMLGDNEPRFSRDIDRLSAVLYSEFNVRPGNILSFKKANLFDYGKGMTWLESQIRLAKLLHPDHEVEILVYYSGHGETQSWFPQLSLAREGDEEGKLSIGLEEAIMRWDVHDKLKGAKVWLLFDTCHAGAWTASVDALENVRGQS